MEFQALSRMARRASKYFPSLETSSEEGLLAIGGSLAPSWLLDAYTHGIFPWPLTSPSFHGGPILAWWSTQPRGIFDWDRIHIPKRLLRTVRNGPFELTCDTDFENVVRACASVPDRADASWITPEMIRAYTTLHELGLAHSVEAKINGKLCGGVYGVALNGLFAAESMFYLVPDASKVALVRLFHHLFRRGYTLLDIQMITENTRRFGAVEVCREEYLLRLRDAMSFEVTFGDALEAFPTSGTIFFQDER